MKLEAGLSEEVGNRPRGEGGEHEQGTRQSDTQMLQYTENAH